MVMLNAAGGFGFRSEPGLLYWFYGEYLGKPVENLQLTVSPNPANVRAEVAYRSENTFEAMLTLHSLGGAMVSAQTMFIQPGVSRAYLDVRQLQPGNYFVRVEDKLTGKAAVVKLLVAR